MNITDFQFDKLFEEFQQFGPRRRIPIEKRWLEMFPSIDNNVFAELRRKCQEIEFFAIALAEKVQNDNMSSEIAKRELVEKYPFLTPERLRRTWNQAMYSAIK